jgi:hypothetical protein
MATLFQAVLTLSCGAAIYTAWRFIPRLPWMLWVASTLIVFAAGCGIIASLRLAA